MLKFFEPVLFAFATDASFCEWKRMKLFYFPATSGRTEPSMKWNTTDFFSRGWRKLLLFIRQLYFVVLWRPSSSVLEFSPNKIHWIQWIEIESKSSSYPTTDKFLDVVVKRKKSLMLSDIVSNGNVLLLVRSLLPGRQYFYNFCLFCSRTLSDGKILNERIFNGDLAYFHFLFYRIWGIRWGGSQAQGPFNMEHCTMASKTKLSIFLHNSAPFR